MAACLACEEQGADVPPSVAALIAPRALQAPGCCDMLSPHPSLATVSFRCPKEGEEAAFHYSFSSHLVVQPTVKGGDPYLLTLDYISGFKWASCLLIKACLFKAKGLKRVIIILLIYVILHAKPCLHA